MYLDRALILLLASVGAVSGFAPGFTSRQTSRVVSGSTLFSEEAAVSVDAEAPAAEAPAAAVEEPQSTYDTQIYIGNLSFDTAESDLRAAFQQHGSVTKVSMPLNRETMKSRGFAFVTMSNAEETAAAIAAVNESEITGRTVYASESLPKEKVAEGKKKYQAKKQRNEGSKIYIGNLNFDTTEEDLSAAFAAYGNVMDCFLPTDYEGNPRGFGFVSMDEEAAAKAIEELNGTELDGRTLTVNKSLPKGQKATPKQIKLYVGNLSWGTEESTLRELFEEYGKVVDCYSPVDRETGQHRGFAFVTMDPDDALRAADETDGYELDGRILRVNEAQPKGYGGRSNDNDGYDGGDAYDESADESWGNDAY
mmetsp:Transcript_5887/g.7440  ORF Transcript_5887/g.7440 Transcript_5887/m.7440 type:complete len:365 (-) Transcript_5887:1377-2471(-)